MSQDKVYVHIKFDLNDDRVCFDDGEFKTIGRYLLDFIYFDFDADAESKDNEHLNMHPYFKLVEKSFSVFTELILTVQIMRKNHPMKLSALLKNIAVLRQSARIPKKVYRRWNIW